VKDSTSPALYISILPQEIGLYPRHGMSCYPKRIKKWTFYKRDESKFKQIKQATLSMV